MSGGWRSALSAPAARGMSPSFLTGIWVDKIECIFEVRMIIYQDRKGEYMTFIMKWQVSCHFAPLNPKLKNNEQLSSNCNHIKYRTLSPLNHSASVLMVFLTWKSSANSIVWTSHTIVCLVAIGIWNSFLTFLSPYCIFFNAVNFILTKPLWMKCYF